MGPQRARWPGKLGRVVARIASSLRPGMLVAKANDVSVLVSFRDRYHRSAQNGPRFPVEDTASLLQKTKTLDRFLQAGNAQAALQITENI